MARPCPNKGAGVQRSAVAWSYGAGPMAAVVRSYDCSCAGNVVDGGGGDVVVIVVVAVGHGAGGIGDGSDAGGGCFGDGRQCCRKTKRAHCLSP